MEEIALLQDESEKLRKYRRLRTTIKGQLTYIHKNVFSDKTISYNDATTRLDQVEKHWKKYILIQEHIESLTDESNLDNEIVERVNMEDKFISVKTKLLDFIKLPAEINSNDKIAFSETTRSGSTTSNLNFVPYDENESFTNFINRLNIFMHLKGNNDNSLKVYTLLHALTPSIHQKLYDLCAPEEPLSKTYDQLVTLLKKYLDPQASVLALQNKFIIREQLMGESVTEFATELKKLSVDCKFLCECGKSVAEMLLRLQFMRGLRDSEIRTRLMQERNLLKFNDILELATAVELSKNENKIISHHQCDSKVHQLNTHSRSLETPKQPKTLRQQTNASFIMLKGRCYRCGNNTHRANDCSFITAHCNLCNKVGHITKVCLSSRNRNKVHQTDQSISEENVHEINLLSSRHNDKFTLEIDIEGVQVIMELDTGAALSIISFRDYKALGITNELHETRIELRTYTGEIIKPVGYAFVNCIYKGQPFIGKIFVAQQNVDPIFGRDWMREVQLDWADIRKVTPSQGSQLNMLLEEFQDIFKTDIGEIPNIRAKLRLEGNTKAIYIKPRQVPYALKEKVEQELERLERLNIITKVDHSDWGSPIVPVVKPNGNIRICADYKPTLNQFLKDERHPIPRIEDIFAKMNGGRLFCTLDISNAYLHMKMDEDSSRMQTLSTHKGLYQVNRLMFGIKVAPSIWQRFMDTILQGIEGVQCFFDDIIIQGGTFEETLARLKRVLQIIKNYNLRLNKDKCKFFQRNIKYLGHTIDENGLHKSKEKTEAIANAKRPENLNELRTFLGLATYYSKFIRNFASIVNPLYKLLQKGKEFHWTDDCERSFKAVKAEIVSGRILVHFNPDLPIVLATDASPVGLGAVLSHRLKDGSERPIAFASRSLTKSESRYSQIDKEATAIYWGLKKFFPYCYGHKFTLITDHKPLVSIFDPQRNLPTLTATRMFNYAHFLSGFDYTIQFRSTNEHSNADFLSRFPHERTMPNLVDEHAIFQIKQLETLPVNKERIAEESRKDEELYAVIEALNKGYNLTKLGLDNHEYTLQDDCLFKGHRIVVPRTLQDEVLRELHVGHLGIVKMKALARSYCYWKGIDHNIEEIAKTCKHCCLKQNQPTKCNVHPWEAPTAPWERLHVDFAGPCLGNNYFFIVVDAFSKWVEVIPTKVTTSEWCIKHLRFLFSTFGIPLVLVSDNGPQFTSHIFKEFLKANGISHKTSAPYHPATNGQAERFVQTIKKSLRAMEEERGGMDWKLPRLLMQLRNAPNSTGSCSYKLMFGRNIHTRLDLLHETPTDTRMNSHTKFTPSSERSFEVGARVQARNYDDRFTKWRFGTVTKRLGKLHYLINMDTGQVWRRHIDQILPTRFKGED